MKSSFIILTLVSVDKILRCYYSNEISLVEHLRSAIQILEFHKKKFGIFIFFLGGGVGGGWGDGGRII